MRRGVSIMGLMLAGTPAMAADCPQSRAVYEADAGSYELAFRPMTEKAAAVTHLFTVTTGKTPLDGLVMETEEPVRTVARIAKDCPDGDVTGEDIRACTGFEGYLYGIGSDGTAGNLPAGDAPAAPRLLFAGLDPALAFSALREKWRLGTVSDSFHFVECGP